MHEIIATLVRALSASKTFDDAAAAVLAGTLKIAGEVLGSSRYAAQGKLLRTMVHLRPEDGYRGLVVLEDGAKQAELVTSRAASDSSASYLPSASAWRWVAEHRSAVAIDVSMGRVQPMTAGSAGRVVETTDLLEGILGRESAERLLGRSSTHLYVLPLRARGEIAGMISLEASCRSAIGREFIWPQCREHLEMLAGIAAPYLFALPLAPVAVPRTDELLPVVGASSAGLVQLARIFARQDETILISGPTGAGKSRLARWCHEQSRRRAQAFEGIDLMAIPDELQMGELFGWKKGAFSGAVADNPGCMSRAEGGTLFIDEIDKLSLKAQARHFGSLERPPWSATAITRRYSGARWRGFRSFTACWVRGKIPGSTSSWACQAGRPRADSVSRGVRVNAGCVVAALPRSRSISPGKRVAEPSSGRVKTNASRGGG